MKKYIYPKDLKLSATVLLWRIRDAAILFFLALGGVILFGAAHTVIPLAAAAVFAVMTIDIDGVRIYDFIRYSLSFFLGQRIYIWRL